MPPRNPQAEKRRAALEQKKAQDIIDYSMTFGSEQGQRVLADLKRRYGWEGNVEAPSFHMGDAPTDAVARDMMKEPIRHILAMLDQPRPMTDLPDQTTPPNS